MKNTLNESKRLQKLAGILKENSDQMGFGSSEPGANIQFTPGNVIKRLDGIAKQHGFAPAITAVKPPLKAVWKSAVGSVALYQDPQSGLVVKWHGMDGSGDQEGIDTWMDPATWEQNFPMAPDDSGDELDGDEDLYEAPRIKPEMGANTSEGVKLGDVFHDPTGIGEEHENYYILTRSINPRKPNTVGLWRVNPKTMVDSYSWPFRKLWSQTEVQDPENITQEEWIRITTEDFVDDFNKLSDQDKQEISAKYKNMSIVPTGAGSFKFVPRRKYSI